MVVAEKMSPLEAMLPLSLVAAMEEGAQGAEAVAGTPRRERQDSADSLPERRGRGAKAAAERRLELEVSEAVDSEAEGGMAVLAVALAPEGPEADLSIPEVSGGRG